VDLHRGDRRAGNRRQQGTAERIPERVAESGLERLDREPRARGREGLFLDLGSSDDEHVCCLLGGGSTSPTPPSRDDDTNVLDAAPLPGPASVVRYGRDVLDPEDLETGRRERTDGRLAAGPGPLDEDVDFREPVLLGTTRGRLGGELGGERRRLARSLEPDVPCARPGERVPVEVRDRHDGVVERRLDVRLPVRDVL